MADEFKSQIGLIGLGTMGSALAEALARAGFDVHAAEPMAQGNVNAPEDILVEPDFVTMVGALAQPRRVLLMVTAGDPVDSVIDQLTPLLRPGDVIIDGGNSNFVDSERRSIELADTGLNFVGTGVSGGEEGARHGASVMAGGTTESFLAARDVLEAIAARNNGNVCCAHVGFGGAGHFVKMVHNGIEYGLMQAIGEAYLLLRQGLRLTQAECGSIFQYWQKTELRSFLIEITAEILGKVDGETGNPLIDFVDDAAEQTGTGRWMISEAMALGVPAPGIAEAVAARSLSGGREIRQAIENSVPEISEDIALSVDNVLDALLATFLCCYAQGFAVLTAGAEKYGWPHREEEIARIWQGGCIIRADLLKLIEVEYQKHPDLPHLFGNDAIGSLVSGAMVGWRTAVTSAIAAGLSIPVMASSVTYLDALKTDRLWTALTQAQRDAFGAHTYRRTDREGSFHSDWATDPKSG